jgi:hypothetical protein
MTTKKPRSHSRRAARRRARRETGGMGVVIALFVFGMILVLTGMILILAS